MSDVTVILTAIEQGDIQATEKLLPLVYEELRRMAHSHMRQERSEHTLQATALVHEAYLRLIGDGPINWSSRARFFAAAAEAMRRILIEHARQRKALRNGGDRRREKLDADIADTASNAAPEDLLDISDALDRLGVEDADMAKLVKLVYFAGLSLAEAGKALNISPATAYRRWDFAKAWIYHAIHVENRPGEDRQAK